MSQRVLWPLLIGVAALGFSASALAQEDVEPAPAQKDGMHPKNRLQHEKSPYLRQHETNPVDWYPWGEEAFAKAKAESKPVFLSIGYATCHWCHVMERESFENDEVAAFLNEHFVAIKVDREERPDVDEIYMSAIQALTGSGGWPLSVFLTPEGKPFSGGTYFPQPARFGRRSFLSVLELIRGVWINERDKVLESAEQITKHLHDRNAHGGHGAKLEVAVLTEAAEDLSKAFDSARGGFGHQTKFPMPHSLSFLMRYHARSGDARARAMVVKTLDAILEGGLRDHLGGGFHRYSTDPAWEIPHFEKMLYDQAGLVRAFAEAFQLTGDARYAAVARETMDYVLREMRDPQGGFTSAWDADSEGVEGTFYVWKRAEVEELLGADFPAFAARYHVSAEGNWHEFPGENHLQFADTLEGAAAAVELTPAALEAKLAACRRILFEARARRVPPLHDDKVLTDWNGLMIGAAALAGRVLGEPRYVQAAHEAATFVLETLRAQDGRLLHRYREGEAAIPAMLEDYAFLAWGLLELFEAEFDPRWLGEARALAERMIEDFWDDAEGGFFQAPAGNGLILRTKPTYDGAIPSGNGAASIVLLRLGTLLQDDALRAKGQATLEWLAHTFAHSGGHGATLSLQGLDFGLGPVREVVIAGDPAGEDTQALLAELRRRFLPRTVIVQRPAQGAEALIELVPFVKEQGAQGGKATAYVCRDYVCQAPVQDVAALGALLDE